MKHHCTRHTDLDELIGHDEAGGFLYGPLSLAMRRGEELELEASDQLPATMHAKLAALLHGVVLVETGEAILPPASFRLVLH